MTVTPQESTLVSSQDSAASHVDRSAETRSAVIAKPAALGPAGTEPIEPELPPVPSLASPGGPPPSNGRTALGTDGSAVSNIPPKFGPLTVLIGDGGGGGSFINAAALAPKEVVSPNGGNGQVIITYASPQPVPPVISGAGGTTHAIVGSTTDTPFAGVGISDANAGSQTLTIRLSDTNATLNGPSLQADSPGVYQLLGSTSTVTSALDALTLTAPATLTGAVDGIEALTLSLSDISSAYPGPPPTASASTMPPCSMSE